MAVETVPYTPAQLQEATLLVDAFRSKNQEVLKDLKEAVVDRGMAIRVEGDDTSRVFRVAEVYEGKISAISYLLAFGIHQRDGKNYGKATSIVLDPNEIAQTPTSEYLDKFKHELREDVISPVTHEFNDFIALREGQTLETPIQSDNTIFTTRVF